MNLVIEGELCDLNKYLKVLSNNRFGGGKIKKSETERVYWECKKQGVRPIKNYPVAISFRWYSKDKKKDLDNISFAKKFILDGLVMAKVLKNDSRKFVSEFEDVFFIDKLNPRVQVVIMGER